jgi:hypothetical protein
MDGKYNGKSRFMKIAHTKGRSHVSRKVWVLKENISSACGNKSVLPPCQNLFLFLTAASSTWSEELEHLDFAWKPKKGKWYWNPRNEKKRKCNIKTKLSIVGIQAHCPLPFLPILNFDAMCFFFLWKPSYYVCGEEECNILWFNCFLGFLIGPS